MVRVAFGGYGGGGAWGGPVPEPTAPNPMAHNLIVFSGVFGTAAAPAERWSCSLRTAYGSLTVAELKALAEDLNPVWANYIGARLSPSSRLTEVTVANVGGDGKWEKTADGSYKVGRTGPIDVPGAGTTPAVYPTQVALCISLLTARSGATGRGRFFIPFPGYALDATTRSLSPADTAQMASSARAFIAAINGKGRDVGVFSSKGYASRVTGVRVGSVPDTMRSRRAQIPEVYATSTAI